MASTTTALPARASRTNDPAAQLQELLARYERNEPVRIPEVIALTKVDHPATRGLAKSLLGPLLVAHAEHNAAQLLYEACAELEYRQPAVLDQAIDRLHKLRWSDELFDLQAAAADHAAQRGELLAALVYAQNAAALDFSLGGPHLSQPDNIRRLIRVYERVAPAARLAAGVTPAARRARRSPAGGKFRLAHVVAQVVDGGHAPSRVTDTLLKYTDRQRYDVFLVISEALTLHPEQPHPTCYTDSSARRAPAFIRRCEEEYGIPVLRPRDLRTCVHAAADLHSQMAERGIDIAFFHGSIATPTDWLLCAWQAAPWQFDRGFGTPLYCPAVDYQFFEIEQTMEALAILCRERGIPYGASLNGSVDVSGIEHVAPLDRAEFGIPAEHTLLGTIGNHLSERMGKGFCEAVARVLRAHPQVTYVVVGAGDFSRQASVFGPDLCAANRPGNRVRFVGPSAAADRWTKTLDIYVNEYPGGGGIAVCEAMAAAKPVVCMPANDTPPALASVTYVGEDNVVQPGTDEGYTRRLAELIENPTERAAFAACLHARYKREFEARRTVEDLIDRLSAVVAAADRDNADREATRSPVP
jgi:glycosyltransferase involved in cell wall biosynthesis